MASLNCGFCSVSKERGLLRAIIFDFDGVLVDSELLIFKLTQEMVAKVGLSLTEEEYFRHYLGLDDREILRNLCRRHGRAISQARLDESIAWKARTYANDIRDGLPLVTGAIEFVRRAKARCPLAVASGSRHLCKLYFAPVPALAGTAYLPKSSGQA